MLEMKSLLRNIIVAAAALGCAGSAAAQKNEFNPVQTGVTSLNIAPDARGAAMGDPGAPTDPDANSQYWNPSKYAFAYSTAAVSLSYTPWLRKLVNDIFLADVAGYWKVGSGDNQAISASLRYFSLGEVVSTARASPTWASATAMPATTTPALLPSRPTSPAISPLIPSSDATSASGRGAGTSATWAPR